MTNNINEHQEETKGLARTIVRLTEVQEKTLDIMIKDVVPTIKSIQDQVFKKPEYLSVGEVANIEGVGEKTILSRIKAGDIPGFKNEGERAYKIPSLEYYETRTGIKLKNSFRNVS